MKENEISKKIRAVTDEEWKETLEKCYTHIEMRLWNKTLAGAHCEQRLGVKAGDYYVFKAYKALFDQTWEWQYEKYDLTTQMVRVINSMISNEVRKFKTERKQNRQLPLLIENDALDTRLYDDDEEDPTDAQYYEKCHSAVEKACEGNETYKQFIGLKLKGKTYDEITTAMECSREEAYQMMENIARKARKILKADK